MTLGLEPDGSSEPATDARRDRAHGLDLLRAMIRIRRFEERAAELYGETKIRGFLHLYVGEEAAAVGVMEALTAEDAVVATYREHGQALARGLPASGLMAEMFGKTTGCSGGRGGSMHFFDVTRRFYGGHAIVGGGLPIAVGLALADAMQDRRRVTACFFGDGAVPEGEFHESLNLAALWHLPVLFVCENNQYAMGTATADELAGAAIHARAETYGIPADLVDGMDVLRVEDAARQAVAAIRSGGGPRFLELRTYRFRAHSMSDPELYRSKDEVSRWRERDPIELLKQRLHDEGVAQDDVDLIEDEIEKELAEAVAFAEAGGWEPVESLMRFVSVRDDEVTR